MSEILPNQPPTIPAEVIETIPPVEPALTVELQSTQRDTSCFDIVPKLEVDTETTLATFVVRRDPTELQHANSLHERAEISPRHHQEHLKAAAFVPGIETFPVNEQDLIGEVLEIGGEALGTPASNDIDNFEALVLDGEEAEELAYVQNWQIDKIADATQLVADLDVQFKDTEMPPLARQARAKALSIIKTAHAETPNLLKQQSEEYRESRPIREAVRRLDEQAHTNEGVPISDEQIEARLTAMPWELPEGIVSDKARDRIERDYSNLITAEQREPLPEDEISVPLGIDEAGADFAMLIESGVSRERINGGTLTRKELLDAGFFFINRMGDGEKPLIDGKIPDVTNPGQELDFSKRAFLTRGELEAVYAYQQEQGAGLNGNPLEQVRADMLVFVESMLSEPLFNGIDDAVEMVFPQTPDDSRWTTGTLEERQAVIDAFKDHHKTYGARSLIMKNRGKFQNRIEESRAFHRGIDVSGGIKVYGRKGVVGGSLPQRLDKLDGTPSPFLESGYHFGWNPDVLLNMPDNQGHQRFNMVNIHLAGGHPDFPGLSEQGQTDWDQRYMSVGDFVKYFYTPAGSPEDVRGTLEMGRLTAHERELAKDLQYLDTPSMKKRLIEDGQKNLIESIEYPK